jgi:hypothetical protein
MDKWDYIKLRSLCTANNKWREKLTFRMGKDIYKLQVVVCGPQGAIVIRVLSLGWSYREAWNYRGLVEGP